MQRVVRRLHRGAAATGSRSAIPARRAGSTGAAYGADRAGGFVAAVERATGDTSTLWAATQTGRVFISRTPNADPATDVTFMRLDSLAATIRTVSSAAFTSTRQPEPRVDLVQRVRRDDAHHARSRVRGDLQSGRRHGDVGGRELRPRRHSGQRRGAATTSTGDFYAATDFGVFRLAAGTTDWAPAASGMPNVEVAGLTIVPADRKLYAATHGLGAWLLNLP